jgi:hypothetical protein
MGSRKPDLLAVVLISSEPEERCLFSSGSVKETPGKKLDLQTGSFPQVQKKPTNLAYGSLEVYVQMLGLPEESASYSPKLMYMLRRVFYSQEHSLSRLYNPAPRPAGTFLLHHTPSSLQTTSSIHTQPTIRLQPTSRSPCAAQSLLSPPRR